MERNIGGIFMISRTKVALSEETIESIFKNAGIEGVRRISPLGEGEYNAVYGVTADKDYVLKIAPAPETPVLTYEKNMMEAEIYWYDIIRENTDIRVPQVYYKDFSGKQIPSDYFIMEKLPGRQRNKITADKSVIAEKTAKMVAQIHNIRNDRFGYVQNELYANWYEALCSMIHNLNEDARKAGKRSKKGERLLNYAHRYKSILTDVPCCMVNYDLWDANVLCTRDKNGEIAFSWIDPERSFWGDRIFDFICLENPFAPLREKKDALKAYNAAAEIKVTPDRETEVRYAFAQGLMGLIQEVEKYYRYTPRHFGWWRNVLSGNLMYKRSFGVLKNG